MKSDLITAIKEAERLAEDGQLKQARIDALDDYLGEPYGNEVEGRSQVVDKTIQNTVEWIKPQLLKVFCSGDEVVKFAPTGPEDIKPAEITSDYINYIATQKNNWFSICYEWFSDALIQKTGYVKAWWDESESIEKEEYDALTDDEFAMLAQDHCAEIIAHDAIPDPIGTQQREEAIVQLQQQLMQAKQAAMQNPQAAQAAQQIGQQLEQVLKTPKPMLHKVTVQRVNKYGVAKLKCLPPEQTLVSHNADNISLQEAPFFEHWEWKTISDLRLEGFDVDDDIGDESEGSLMDEQSRGTDAWNWTDQSEEADPSMRRVKVREVWIRFDANGDGKAELLHCIVVGNDVLEQEEADLIPVAALTPQMLPHRHTGMSIRDAVEDLQFIKTMLTRGLLDNVYLANNGRFAIDVDRVSLEDMMTSRPGGLVRTQGDPAGAIMPLTHQANFAPVMQALAYIDDTAESRTGVTKYTQGMDANNLNKTATGVQSIMSAAQERVMLIARVMAETGIKEAFYILHSLVRKHQTKPDIVMLRNEWVPVDPRTWQKRTDMTISVGLGTGNKQEQLGHLANLFQMQMAVLQTGMPVVTPVNIHETLKQIAKNAGFRQPELFVSDPAKAPPQQPQPDPRMELEKMKLTADAQKFQAQTHIEQQKAQQQLQQEQLRSQNDVQIEMEKTKAMAELERYKAQLKAQTELEIARIKAQSEAESIVNKTQIERTSDTHKAGLEQMLSGAGEREQAIVGMIQQLAQMVEGSKVVGIKRVRDKAGKLVGGVQVRADGTEIPISIQ